jgi:hypothetical protein
MFFSATDEHGFSRMRRGGVKGGVFGSRESAKPRREMLGGAGYEHEHEHEHEHENGGVFGVGGCGV